MEEAVNALVDSFFNQHIMVKNEWITSVLQYLQKWKSITPSTKIEAVFALAFEQWLFSDLNVSSFSGFDQCGLSAEAVKQTLQAPVIVQIASISDIGSSFQSQYRKLTYEFHDDTGFEALPDTDDQANRWDKPRRMLRMELSDGTSVFRACESQHIPALSILTPPGCKLLLVPPLLCRRGIFMLTKNNIHVLGGEVQSLFETGRPVQVMGKKLGYAPIPSSSARKSTTSDRISSVPNTNRIPDVDRPAQNSILANPACTNSLTRGNQSSRNFPPSMDVHESTAVNSNRSVNKPTSMERTTNLPNSRQFPNTVNRSFVDDPFSDEETATPSFPPLTHLQRSSPEKSPLRCQVPPKGMLASSSNRSPTRRIVLGDTPPTYEEFCSSFSSSSNAAYPSLSVPADPFPPSDTIVPRKRPSSVIRTSDNENSFNSTRDRTSITGLAKELPRLSVPVTSSPLRNSLRSPPKKRVSMKKEIKTEIIVLSDDEDDVKPSTSACSKLRIRDESVNSTDAMEAEDTVDDFNPFTVGSSSLAKYSNLMRQKNIQKIASVLRKMRFVLGSQRHFVQAVMTNVLEPMRVVDLLWTQKVQLMDDSAEIVCYIDDRTIVSVLGLTVTEALAIRNSSDKEKRKEGTRRIKATEKQFHRLDLVCEIEFFSDGDTTPVVRSISTMASFLDVL